MGFGKDYTLVYALPYQHRLIINKIKRIDVHKRLLKWLLSNKKQENILSFTFAKIYIYEAVSAVYTYIILLCKNSKCAKRKIIQIY